MEEQLISFETAKLAKEKGFILGIGWFGFNNKFYVSEGAQIGMLCDNHRGENPVACTQSLLQKWLREKHKIHIQIQVLGQFVNGDNKFYSQVILFGDNKWISKFISNKLTYTYEEALEIGLQEALKSIK